MAYCKRCGAYIPDGLSACLACGYDEAAENAGNGGQGAAAREQQNEDFRRKYEEERRKRQEENQRWAEEERRRRDEEERRRLEEERRRLEEERKRLEKERILKEAQERRRGTYTYTGGESGVGGTRSAKTASTSTNEADRKKRGRILGALSYLSMLWILPFIFCRDDDAARYHARQGLTLFLFSVICDAIGSLTGFGWILSLFRFYCIYKGMTNALNGREEPLPLIGDFADRIG